MRRARHATTPFVPTPPAQEATQRLSPDAAVASYGWAYDFSKFLGDAATGDGQWNDRGFPGTGATVWVRFSCPTPGGNLTGTQTFRVRAKASSTSGTPKIAVRVFENGTERASLTAQNLTTLWATYSWTWDASILADPSGAGVELRLDFRDGTSGAGYGSFDAVDWIARYTTSAPQAETWPSDWGDRPQLGIHHGITQPFVDGAREAFNAWLGRPANVALVFAPPVSSWGDLAGGADDADTTWSGQLAAPVVARAFDPSIWPVNSPLLLAIATIPTSHANLWDTETWTNPTIWAEIAAGTFDLYYTRLFRRLARRCAQTYRSPRTVVILLAAECNHRDVPHAVGPNVADFIAAWQKIVTLAHTAAESILGSGQKFKIGFLPSQHLFFGAGSGRLADLYPGDAYVDHLGLIVRDYWGVANPAAWSAILTYPVTLAGATAEGVHDWLDFCASRSGKWLGLHCRTNYVGTSAFPRTADPESWWAGVDNLRRRYDSRLAWITHTWTAETRLDQPDGWGEPYRRRYGVSTVRELSTPLRTVAVANASQLSSALANAQPGDHIVLANGTYTGNFTLTAAGTAANPIVVKAANLLGATISGTFRLDGAYGQLYGLTFASNSGIGPLRGSYTKVRRCKFNGGYTANEAITIEINGTDVEIAWNEFSTFSQRAVSVRTSGGARRAWIHHNYFHNWQGTPGTNAREAIQLGMGVNDETTVASCVAEYNLFDDVNVDDECISIKSCGNIVRYNTLLNSPIASIHNRTGHDNQVLANWVEASGGIRVMDRDTVLLGNVVTTSGNYQVFAGDRGPDDPVGNPPRYYPAAWNTIMAGNIGPIRVGHYYSTGESTMTIPARNTRIEAHNGTITYVRHDNTSVMPSTSRTIPQAVKLRPIDVGPNAG